MIETLVVVGLGYGAYRWWRRGKGLYHPAPKGDRLEIIAARFDVLPEAILALNGPGFARIYAPNGQPVPFKLPGGAKDSGAVAGAQGRYKP